MKTRLVPIAAIAAAISVGLAPSASAATNDTPQATSANWSGYVAGGSSASATTQFSSVSGSWVEPSVDCSTSDGDAAFWVGLGGSGQGNGSLEQVGTQANCSNQQGAYHYAWYELVPQAPVMLDIAISPGDRVAANVSVSGSTVTVSLTDQTTGASTRNMLQMQNPDVSTADWIAEAPSECDSSGSCTPLPLPDFGSVSITGASATANGHTGTISDPSWSSQAVQLGGAGQLADPSAGLVGDGSSAGATPSSLSSDGSSFSVAWESADTQQSQSSGDPGASGYGYPGDGPGYTPGYDYGAGY
jgi:hypothetical protein